MKPIEWLENLMMFNLRNLLLPLLIPFSFLYGLLIISIIDNVLKPKFISSKIRIHTVLVLMGILGGITLFGLIGIILGPLIMAMFLAIIKIAEDEKLFY